MMLTIAVLIAGAVFAATLAGAVMALPDPPVRLAPQVAENLDASGVTHPVTAVLLNFRGYDTLLEIAVLLLALLGILAVSGSERNTRHNIAALPQPLLQSFARIVVPLMVLVSGYLLWAGSHQPGGAFQAAAVLAAAGILLYLARLMPAWATPSLSLRTALVGGLVVFLAIAALPLFYGDALLQYPQAWSGGLILAIEAGLTFSLALVLAGQFLWLPNEDEEAEE
jgi:multisubunit Na+/H+ antiporter MnhB subunit